MLALTLLTVMEISAIISGQPVGCNERDGGQERQVANGYFRCVNGTYTPSACVTDDGTRVAVEATYIKATYPFVLQCVQHGNGLTLTPVACQQNGSVIQIGESYAHNSFWFTCKQKSDNYVVFEASGCVSPSGERISANDTFNTRDFVYLCYVTLNGGVFMEPQRCIFNGHEYQPEEDVIGSTCWYRCERTSNNGMRLQIAGCLEEGTKYQVGETFVYGQAVYKCVRNADESVSRELTGCAESGANPVRHSFGDRWTEGQSELKYTIECNGNTGSLNRRQVQCVYDGPNGVRITLDGGCFKRVSDSALFSCRRYQEATGATGDVYGQLFTGRSQEYEKELQSQGLRLC